MKRQRQGKESGEEEEHVGEKRVDDEENDEVDSEIAQESRVDENMKEEREDGHNKPIVPGVVYISYVPPRMRVKHVRHFLSPFGEMGRVFLQPEEYYLRKRRKKAGNNGRNFTEGWAEFHDKRVAKLVATMLNNAPISTKKKSLFYDDLWNIKYLHRFHWCHLTERLTYERMVRQQRFRQEISQAKRETSFFAANVERSKAIARVAKKQHKEGRTVLGKTWTFKQRCTEDEVQQKMKAVVMAGSSGYQGPGHLESNSKNLAKAREKINRLEERTKSSRTLLTQIFGKPAV
uniref:activator of basal transcription 1 n=1 Tax=Myxine glutinosa TaxID=7769 RepID=UPI00358FD22E